MLTRVFPVASAALISVSKLNVSVPAVALFGSLRGAALVIVPAVFRKRVMVDFPYAIFYMQGDTDILIVAVMHTSREPDYWLDRID